MCLGIPGKLIEKKEEANSLPMGKVEFGGILKEVCLAYTPEAEVGDYILVHVGFSLSVISESEARDLLALVDEISLQEEISSQEERTLQDDISLHKEGRNVTKPEESN